MSVYDKVGMWNDDMNRNTICNALAFLLFSLRVYGFLFDDLELQTTGESLSVCRPQGQYVRNVGRVGILACNW